MSYYYHKKYSYKGNYYRPSSSPKKADISPSKAYDITSFIKNEFFNADYVLFNEVTNLYRLLYGPNAYKYMMSTFPSWKSGSVGLSKQTMRRILECVPKFLSPDKKFYILKCEIIYFIDTLHFKQQNKKILLPQLNDIYENYANEIDNFNQINLSWFVGKGIFTETEIQEFLLVCKYALNKRLNLSFRQVQCDLILIKSKLSDLKEGCFHANYQIDFLNSNIDLSNIIHSTLDFIQLNKHEVKLEGIFKKFAEQYILEELLKMTFFEQTGEINHYVKAKDLDFFISQYNQVLDCDNEASLKSEFKGEGGLLKLSLEVKSVKKIQLSLFLDAAKLTLYISFFLTLIILIFAFNLYKISALILLGVLIVGFILIGSISTKIKSIKNLILDLKLYGK